MSGRERGRAGSGCGNTSHPVIEVFQSKRHMALVGVAALLCGAQLLDESLRLPFLLAHLLGEVLLLRARTQRRRGCRRGDRSGLFRSQTLMGQTSLPPR